MTNFAATVFHDPTFDYTGLTGVINALIVPARMRTMLWKIIHNGLYVGRVARSYQLNKRFVPQGCSILVPEYCPYAAHQFSVGYRSAHVCGRKQVADRVPTYDYIFWDGPLASTVWGIIQRELTAMGMLPLQRPLRHWTDVFTFLASLKKSDFTTGGAGIYIQTGTLVTGLWVLYSNYKLLTDKAMAAQSAGESISDAEIDCWPLELQRSLHRQLSTIAFTLPVMNTEARKRGALPTGGRRYNERQRAMFPPSVVKTILCNDDVRLFQLYWAKTSIVTVTQNILHIQAFNYHYYPP